MPDIDLSPLFELTGTDNFEDALICIENERATMSQFGDENEALKILVRRFKLVLPFALSAINIIETEVALFLTEKARVAILKFKDANALLGKSMVLVDEIVQRK